MTETIIIKCVIFEEHVITFIVRITKCTVVIISDSLYSAVIIKRSRVISVHTILKRV